MINFCFDRAGHNYEFENPICPWNSTNRRVLIRVSLKSEQVGSLQSRHSDTVRERVPKKSLVNVLIHADILMNSETKIAF